MKRNLNILFCMSMALLVSKCNLLPSTKDSRVDELIAKLDSLENVQKFTVDNMNGNIESLEEKVDRNDNLSHAENIMTRQGLESEIVVQKDSILMKLNEAIIQTRKELKSAKDSIFAGQDDKYLRLHRSFDSLSIAMSELDSNIQNKFGSEILNLKGEFAALHIIMDMQNSSIDSLRKRQYSDSVFVKSFQVLELPDSNRKVILGWKPSSRESEKYEVVAFQYRLKLEKITHLQYWPYATNNDTIPLPGYQPDIMYRFGISNWVSGLSSDTIKSRLVY
jgi:hypothetical protein